MDPGLSGTDLPRSAARGEPLETPAPSPTDAGERLGISPSVARAAVGWLVTHGGLRVDVQRSQTGWPVCV